MNLHTPERQPNESQANYRARQAASRKAFAASQSMAPAVRESKPLTTKHKALLLQLAARRANTGQKPKFAAPRQRKQHAHPLRDESGAFTYVGARAAGRRVWLAGISAQRGY